MTKGTSDTITEGIRVRVGAQFVPDQSDPDRRHYVFAYRVTISNEGTQPAQLLSRHWMIRDAQNELREVRGPGVVGEKPRLVPGESYEYMSACPLPTKWGTMEGTYTMQRDDGSRFEAQIGRFFLAPNTEPLSAPTRS